MVDGNDARVRNKMNLSSDSVSGWNSLQVIWWKSEMTTMLSNDGDGVHGAHICKNLIRKWCFYGRKHHLRQNGETKILCFHMAFLWFTVVTIENEVIYFYYFRDFISRRRSSYRHRLHIGEWKKNCFWRPNRMDETATRININFKWPSQRLTSRGHKFQFSIVASRRFLAILAEVGVCQNDFVSLFTTRNIHVSFWADI